MENRVVVLGSGTCVSSLYNSFDFRNPSGYLLQFEGINILLDCGEGMRAQMDKLGFDYFDINYIFITHFHPDHFNLDSFIQSIYVRARKSGVKKTLIIYGPKNIERIFETSWDSKHTENSYKKDLLSVLDLKFIEYGNEKKINISQDAKVFSHKVCHGEMDAYGLRFLLGDKTIAYSGDCGMCDELIKISQNADIFLCSVAININDNENNPKSHLSYVLAGEVANKSNTKKLVLVHYSGKDSESIMEQEVRKSGFNGGISVAKDLGSFDF